MAPDTIARKKSLEVGWPNQNEIDELNRQAWQLRHSDIGQALQLSERAAMMAGASACDMALADALRTQSFCHLMLSNLRAALDAAHRALELCQAQGDQGREAHLLAQLGLIYHRLAANESQALHFSLKSLQIFREIGELLGEAEALNVAGLAYTELGDYERALDYLQASYRLYERLDYIERAIPLNNIGIVCGRLGEHEQALTYYRTVLEILRKKGDRWGEASTLRNMGIAHFSCRDFPQAMDCFQVALTLFRECGDRGGATATSINIATLFTELGRHERALDIFKGAIAILEEMGDSHLQIDAYLGLGALHLKQKQPEQALAILTRALTLVEPGPPRAESCEVHRALAESYEQLGRWSEALAHYKQFHAAERIFFQKKADLRLRSLQISFEVEQAKRERELYRIKHEELTRANDELQGRNHLLEVLNEQKSYLLEQLEKQRQLLKKQATEDYLTRLYNRRYFDRQLEHHFLRARSHQQPLTVALADIDHFKEINDRFSHLIGDETLRAVAGVLKQQLRHTDTIARYGGEEFVILFPDTTLEEAVVVCERVRRKVEEYPWHEIHPHLTVTISFGLSDQTTVDQHQALLADADKKLYIAKRRGRNQLYY